MASSTTPGTLPSLEAPARQVCFFAPLAVVVDVGQWSESARHAGKSDGSFVAPGQPISPCCSCSMQALWRSNIALYFKFFGLMGEALEDG